MVEYMDGLPEEGRLRFLNMFLLRDESGEALFSRITSPFASSFMPVVSIDYSPKGILQRASLDEECLRCTKDCFSAGNGQTDD
jgi:hypothetical protein